MVIALNPWRVTVARDGTRYEGTAILADGGPDMESTSVLVIHAVTKRASWIMNEYLEWWAEEKDAE